MHAKGVVLCKRACFCLLSAFYKTLPSKNPSKNLCLHQRPLQAPSKNPSKKHLLLENLLRTLLRSVRLHDPLGVHPVLTRSMRAKRAFLESPFLLCPLKVCSLNGLKDPGNLKGTENKRALQKRRFGQPFLRTTPSPLLWRAPIQEASITRCDLMPKELVLKAQGRRMR